MITNNLPRIFIAIGMLVVAGLLVLVGVGKFPTPTTTQQETATQPWVQQPHQVTETVQVKPVEAPVTLPEPETPTTTQPTLEVPSLNLSVPLRSVQPVDGVATPPDFTEAFTVDGWTAPTPTEGTTYVIFHSRRDGTGIGNKFFNQQTGEPVIHIGATVKVNSVEFQVENITTSPIEDLPNNRMWTSTPGKLYLVTCLQNAERTHSAINFIVEATIKQ